MNGEEGKSTLALTALVFLAAMLVTGRGYGTRLERSYRLRFRNRALNETSGIG